MARYFNAPLILLIWQVAPFRISAGGGGGQFTFRDYDGTPGGMSCIGPYPGSAPRSEPDPYRSYGVATEVRIGNLAGFRAALGNTEDPSEERDGMFGAGQVGVERRLFGAGLGIAVMSGTGRRIEPSASLRVGRESHVSLRADYRRPEPGMGLIGGPRIGVALGDGKPEGVRVLAGVARTPVPDSARRSGAFLDVAVPLRFEFGRGGLGVTGFLSGSYEGQQRKPIYGVGAYGWISP